MKTETTYRLFIPEENKWIERRELEDDNPTYSATSFEEDATEFDSIPEALGVLLDGYAFRYDYVLGRLSKPELLDYIKIQKRVKVIEETMLDYGQIIDGGLPNNRQVSDFYKKEFGDNGLEIHLRMPDSFYKKEETGYDFIDVSRLIMMGKLRRDV